MLCESDSSDPKYHEREGECTTLEEGGRKPVKKGGKEEGREEGREGRREGANGRIKTTEIEQELIYISSINIAQKTIMKQII